jgi:hypothetical protein
MLLIFASGTVTLCESDGLSTASNCSPIAGVTTIRRRRGTTRRAHRGAGGYLARRNEAARAGPWPSVCADPDHRDVRAGSTSITFVGGGKYFFEFEVFVYVVLDAL